MEYGFHGFVIEQLNRKSLIVSSYSFDVILMELKKSLNLPGNAHQCGSRTVFQLKNSRAATVTCKRQSEPVFVDLLRSVPEFIDPVLAMKTSSFVKTSLNRSFSFQTLLRDISFSLF